MSRLRSGRHGEWLQYNGLAKAVVSQEFLEAVQYAGDKRRVGFAVVAWSSHGNVREIVPWMVVSSVADARRVAERIRNAPRFDRSSWEDSDDAGAPTGDPTGNETDMSATIDAAVGFVVAAPFLGDRGVINILANGPDNVGSGPRLATNRAVGFGFTVNGVAFGGAPDLADYFRYNVIGGLGSFVEHVDADPTSFNTMMVRKLLQDLTV